MSLMKMIKRFALLLIISMFLGLVTTATLAQSGKLYFPESDHWVEEPFLSFYQATPDAEFVFGNPNTNAYQTSWTTVQYFENVRLEIDTSGDVIISPLGDLFYEISDGVKAAPIYSSNCEKDEQWNHPICFSFLDFYLQFGGENIFGKPISGLEYIDDVLVQNFLNARFEWHPNQPEFQTVSLTSLGMMFLNEIGENEDNNTLPVETSFEIVEELNIWGIVSNIVTLKDEIQILSVYVRDQNNNPVENVNIFVNIIYGKNLEYPQQTLPVFTDANGLAIIEFPVLDDSVGEVQIVIVGNYKVITKSTRSSFFIWY